MTHSAPISAIRHLTVAKVLADAAQRLTAANCDTPRLDAEVLLAYTLTKDRTWLYTYPETEITVAQRDHFLSLVARREQREPVAYLVGHKAFFGLDFLVNRDTLIPRPETELLVETALQIARSRLKDESQNSLKSNNRQLQIVDVGTGTGCIAITLARRLTQANFTAIDISEPALTVAQKNAERHQVTDRIRFVHGDLLEPLYEPVDLIVSNPPYVHPASLQTPLTSPEVHKYEPQLALSGGEDGLAVIRRLVTRAGSYLKPNGSLLVEIGYDQGETVRNLAQARFTQANVEIKQDLAGLDRLLVVEK